MAGVVAPEDCLIMISFNDRSAGPNAETIARFLTKKSYPTFCTRIYCPATLGDWRDATEMGVANCKIYIPLLTKGWQESTECQYETRLIRNRIANQDVKVIPVYYEDFDETYDKKTNGHNYKFKWNDLQSVFRQKGDEDKWMNTILSLLPTRDTSDPMQNAKSAQDTDNNATGETDDQRKRVSFRQGDTLPDSKQNAKKHKTIKNSVAADDPRQNRHVFLSARFDGGEKERKAREAASALRERGVNVYMVEAGAGQAFGAKTMYGLNNMDIMIAFCFSNYGEKTRSKYCTYFEVKCASEKDIPILPIKFCDEWPPTPPRDHDGNWYGHDQNNFVFSDDLVYSDWSRRIWDPVQWAEEAENSLKNILGKCPKI